MVGSYTDRLLSWKSFNVFTPENRSARFLTMSTEASSLLIDYAWGEFGGPTLNKFSFSAVSFPSRALPLTTFNNSKLTHTLFSRLVTMNFTFKSSNNLDWFGLAISKQLLFTLSGLALHSEESRPRTSRICFTAVPLELVDDVWRESLVCFFSVPVAAILLHH